MAKQILIKPIITEKAELLSESRNKYSFVVKKDANKVEIRKAVEAMYNVNVVAVNTIITPGKVKIRGTRGGQQKGRISPVKKAVITIEAGETIDFYSGI
jgi:large subunit ribosomal protein L23